MKAFKTILIICAALCITTSCKKEADMTLAQKTVLENNTLRQIHTDGAWEVAFVYDSLNAYVELEYSAYLEDYVSVKETNGWLSIGFSQPIYKQPGSVFKATIHTMEKEFLTIQAENACVISIEGFELEDGIDLSLHNASICSGFEVYAPSCSILVTDDSQLLDARFTGAVCAVSVTKNSSCKGYFNVGQSFNAKAKIQSQLIIFGGLIPSAAIEADNESIINMAGAEVEDLSVLLKDGSEATVKVSHMINGFLLSSSILYYKGHPQFDVDCSEDSFLIPL